MFKLLFSFFLIIHILGDFYFQSDKLAERKRREYKYVLLHSLYYLIASLLCALPFLSNLLLISVILLSLLHFAVDSVKFLCTMNKEQNAAIYIIDQLSHLAFIAVSASILTYTGFELKLSPDVNVFLLGITQDPLKMLNLVGLILIAFKPANVTIKQLVSRYKPAENNFETQNRGGAFIGTRVTITQAANKNNSTVYIFDTFNNAGAFIGTLERLIILLLLSVGQYPAIGLVLTAKSVARYNKISEDKQFAEYYLLGTLLSSLFAISTYFIFN